jgi:orotate phosphoribosyltransferase-like protein
VDDVELDEDIRAVKIDRELVVKEEDTAVLDTVLGVNIGAVPVTTIVIKLLELGVATVAFVGVACSKNHCQDQM